MDDETTLSFIQNQAANGAFVLSVCTGTLLCGASGLLNGRRATTHWASLHLLPYFGAIPSTERVVQDGRLISTAGVTAGIDGALRLAALLQGDAVAGSIELMMQYAPEPPFHCGTPDDAPPEMVTQVRESLRSISARRLATATRYAAKARYG